MILFSQGSSSAGIDCEHLPEKWNNNFDPLHVGRGYPDGDSSFLGDGRH